MSPLPPIATRGRVVLKRLPALVGLAVGLAAARPAAAFTVTDVQAHAEPAHYYGSCPVTVNFVGVITTDGPGTVTYRWEHSPGTGVPESVSFSGAGSRTVTKARDLSASDFLELTTLSPNTRIAHADTVITCQLAGPKTDLTIPSLTFRAWGTCISGETLFTLNARIRNIGPAAYPLANQHARLIARDSDNASWFGIAEIPGMIPANGGEVTVEIPVRYPGGAALVDHLSAAASHQFRAEVDDLMDVDEALETNNLSSPVSVAVKAYCTAPLKRRPPPLLVPRKIPIPKPDPGPLEKLTVPGKTIVR